MAPVLRLIASLLDVLIVIIVVDVLLSYVMDAYHPVKRALDQVIEPMLRPIRNIMPRTGMIDFSPMILIIILSVIGRILLNWAAGE